MDVPSSAPINLVGNSDVTNLTQQQNKPTEGVRLDFVDISIGGKDWGRILNARSTGWDTRRELSL